MDLGHEGGWHGEHEALHQHAWAWAPTQAQYPHHGQAQDSISLTTCFSTWVSSEEAFTTGDTMERGAVATIQQHPKNIATVVIGATTHIPGAGRAEPCTADEGTGGDEDGESGGG